MTASENGVSNPNQQGIENPTRSVPPGTLLYSQLFSCPPYNGLRSETLTTNSETADDFILGTGSPISIVRWWFFMAADPLTTDWIIRIYDNQNCLPSSLLQTWNIPATEITFEYACSEFGMNVYDLWAGLTPAFVPSPGTYYWISIQAVAAEEFWCTYGNSGDYLNCPGAFKSAYFGFPDFTSTLITQGESMDFTFELYTSEQVPVSDWALYLGIVLIIGFAIFQVFRIVR